MKEIKDELNAGAKGIFFSFGRNLRKKQTDAERILWSKLRGRTLKRIKFRRQHPLGNYIADFYCYELKLVIELDGCIHDSEEAKQNDSIRTRYLEEQGCKVLRFRNEDVFQNLDGVLERIICECFSK